MDPTPWLKNRRTGVILPFNPHLATHPDMVACEELPWKQERHPPEKPTTRRHVAATKKAKAEKTETKKTAKKAPRTQVVDPTPEPSGSAEIDDLLAGIEHG